MSHADQNIWTAAYDEEFDGLSSLPTWDIITEDQFHCLGNGIKALPSMAIATIKYDEFNRPKRAKYRIVVLGNLDYHSWSKESTKAPVMSQLELRILTSLAVIHKRVLKSCPICLLKNNILLSHQLVVLDLNLVLIGIYVDLYMDSNGLQNCGLINFLPI